MNSENNAIEQQECLTQFLSFTLGTEAYGINILRVQEIRGWEEVREIPDTPEYLKGVLNLRNIIVPIVDLRIRFGLQNVEYRPTTVIIVLSVQKQGENHVMGIVVDAVSDVLDVQPGDIRKAPDFGTKINTRYINGLVMVDERVVIILNTDRLLDQDELANLEHMAEQAPDI